MRAALAILAAALSLATPAQAASERSGREACKVRGYLRMAYVQPQECPAEGLDPKSALARPYMGGRPEPDTPSK